VAQFLAKKQQGLLFRMKLMTIRQHFRYREYILRIFLDSFVIIIQNYLVDKKRLGGGSEEELVEESADHVSSVLKSRISQTDDEDGASKSPTLLQQELLDKFHYAVDSVQSIKLILAQAVALFYKIPIKEMQQSQKDNFD